MDNYFTSLALARDLLKVKKATLVVTIPSNRVELPNEFVAPAGRELYSSLVGFNETGDSSFISYKCKENKVVVILSTMHLSDITFGKEPKKTARSHQLLYHDQRRSGLCRPDDRNLQL